MKEPQTKEQYIIKLKEALRDRKITDIDDIILDYEDYFVQTATKGYSELESIKKLPAIDELADSYIVDNDDITHIKQSSLVKRLPAAMATLIMDIVVLPIWAIFGLLLACIAIIGVLLSATGIFMLVPQGWLGPINVPNPPSTQFIPAVGLLITSGIAVLGLVALILDWSYSMLRRSVYFHYLTFTGQRVKHLKFVPTINKHVRTLLIKTTLFTGVASIVFIIILTIISLITNHTVHFADAWL